MHRSLQLFLAAALVSAAAFGVASAKEAEVGKAAPDFSLKDTDGNAQTLKQYAGKVVVLEWFNADCPFVKYHHGEAQTMDKVYAKYSDKIVWLAINSSAEGKQGFGLERNQTAKKEYGIDYPVLLDSDGKVGKAYGAKSTPHMFVINAEGKVVYKGAIDDDPTIKGLAQVNYVDQALRELLAGGALTVKETKQYGCSVKYAQ